VIELSFHGSPAVLTAAVDALIDAGCRLAQPGEFTFRAFSNGRIDLTQAEAVIDIINAHTESALHVATSQIQGALKEHVESIRAAIGGILAETEAAIDFPDDVGEEIDGARILGRLMREAIGPLKALVSHYEAGHVLRDGLKVIVAGQPNVGKSSLMNRLLERDRAIVTPIPGTTRDFIEEPLVIRGIPILLTDTAGLHATEDPIERIGIEQAVARIEAADLVLLMTAAGSPLTDADREIYRIVQGNPVIWVENKCDLAGGGETIAPESWQDLPRVAISALRNQGIGALKQMIESVALQPSLACESALVPNLRHKGLIEAAAAALDVAAEGIQGEMPFELVNMDIRSAHDLLDEILGDTLHEDILDQIFERFCIGK
jgi:tRNA modification GTPase